MTVLPATPRRGRSAMRVGMVSTLPPTLCGLATFATALGAELTRRGHVVDYVRAASDLGETLDALDQDDVVVVQHEYGIYGGADGADVLVLLEQIAVPVVAVLHTVPLVPTAHQRHVLMQVIDLADGVVVLSASAYDRLVGRYGVDPAVVTVIPHGALVPNEIERRIAADDPLAPEFLTWGLLGPGKGIEHVIGAVAALARCSVPVRYTVAGVTHPNVLANQGDGYRRSLVQLSTDLGVADAVTFDGSYRDVATLTRFVTSATAVVLPYDSRDQVTSGVLVDAIAAGRPVIATRFPHATELLGSGAGILVDHMSSVGLAAAMRTVVEHPERRRTMAAATQELAVTLSWPAVTRGYEGLFDSLLRERTPVAS